MQYVGRGAAFVRGALRYRRGEAGSAAVVEYLQDCPYEDVFELTGSAAVHALDIRVRIK